MMLKMSLPLSDTLKSDLGVVELPRVIGSHSLAIELAEVDKNWEVVTRKMALIRLGAVVS